jgi:hypothetical protein
MDRAAALSDRPKKAPHRSEERNMTLIKRPEEDSDGRNN